MAKKFSSIGPWPGGPPSNKVVLMTSGCVIRPLFSPILWSVLAVRIWSGSAFWLNCFNILCSKVSDGFKGSRARFLNLNFPPFSSYLIWSRLERHCHRCCRFWPTLTTTSTRQRRQPSTQHDVCRASSRRFCSWRSPSAWTSSKVAWSSSLTLPSAVEGLGPTLQNIFFKWANLGLF